MNCKEDVPLQGFNPDDGFDPDRRGNVLAIAKASVEEVTFSDTVTVTGRTPFLSVGSYRGLETQTLLKFARIPDSLQVLAATILLRTNSLIGDKSTKRSFMATVHQITQDWGDSTVTAQNFGNAFEPTAIGRVELLSKDRGSDSSAIEIVRINLDQEYLPAVIDSTSLFNRNGVLIDHMNSTFVKEFFSINNTSNRPQLELRVAGDTTETTVFIDVTEDAYLVHDNAMLPNGPLYVDNLFSRQSFVKFELSEIPRESTINRAVMRLNILEDLTIIKKGGFSSVDNGFALQINRLIEPFQPPNTFRVDSTFTPILAVVLTEGGSAVVPDQNFRTVFRRMIQDWTSERVENHGFVMRTFAPGFDVSRLAIRPASDGISGAPTLEIDYSVAPNYP